MAFFRGDDVEVASKEIGFGGSYYAAIIITPLQKKDYIVQYRNLVKDDFSGPLRDFIEADKIRPVPAEIPATRFRVGDKVDAFHNDGWWFGKISKKIGANYSVYFEHSKDELEYSISELRVHQDWVDGKWVSSYEKEC